MTGKPTPVKRYHDYLLQTVTDLNVSSKWFVSPLNLGGVPGEDGGSGIPLAGVVGQLIQSKVAYDTTEASTLDTPASGASLVDNLNHIRYWIDTVSGGGGATTFLDLTDTPSDYTGYYGYSAVVNVAEDGLDFINVSGGAGADTKKVMVSSDDTTEGYLEDKLYGGNYITITTVNPGGNEQSQISASMSIEDLNNVTTTDIQVGESLVYEGLGEWINVMVSGGGGSSYTYALDDVTSQIPASGDNFNTAATPASGSLVVHFNGLTQQPNNYNIIASGFHTLFSPIAGDELVAEYYTDVPSESILALTLDVEDASTPVASNVEVLNFEGMDVSVDGSTVTISGGTGSGGGGDISIDDEGIEITSAVTSLDFVGDQITATNVGNDVTVTFSGIVVTPPPFIGCKTYRTTDFQLSAAGGWQNLNWEAEEYDTDTMWSTGANHDVNTAGYYSVIGQVTLSGALPTDSLQFGIFKDSTLISTGWSGFLTTTSGNRTYRLVGEGYFLDTQYIRAQIVCFSGDQPYVLSGVANSFLSTHQIQGVFIEGATPEICRVAYTSYLNVSDSTDTAIPWSNETYDTGSFWAASPNPSRFTISTDGYYNLKAIGLWETVYYQGVTPFTIRIAFRKNGTTRLANHWEWNDVNTGGARSEGLSTQITADVYLESGDYIEVVVYHEKGSVANGIIRANDTIASIHRIG